MPCARNWGGLDFRGSRAQTRVDKLSGGERARLALALITRDAPHLLILDEPTNHLDVDAREALIQALNDYSGAVILISHDRHMVELTADRLVLVDDGTAREYAGSMEDYIDFVLGRKQPKGDRGGGSDKPRNSHGANAVARARIAKSELTKAEKAIARLTAEMEELDRSILERSGAKATPSGGKMQDLLTARAEAGDALAEAEQTWLVAGTALEAIELG